MFDAIKIFGRPCVEFFSLASRYLQPKWELLSTTGGESSSGDEAPALMKFGTNRVLNKKGRHRLVYRDLLPCKF